MRVLFIEDNQDDVLYVRELLREAAAKAVELECAPGLSAGIEMLARDSFDIVLLDLSLPECRGLDTFERVRAAAPETPVVVLSGLADDATAIEAVKRGAQDYLVKGHVTGGLLLLRTLRYAVERDQSRKAMGHRVEMEKLVSAISTGFVNLRPDETDRGILSALERMGRFCGVDRSYVFLLSDDGKTMDNTHEWCADGIEPQIANLKDLALSDFPWAMGRLLRLETVHVPRVCDLPPEADPEKESFQAHRIRSLVLVPMSSGGRLIGFLGFDSVRGEKAWSQPDVTLLEVVGEVFVSAIEHRRAEEEITRTEARFRALFESCADCILVIGADCRYLFANKAALEFLGLVGRNIVGKHVTEVLAAMPEIQEPWMEQLAQVLATAEPLRVEQHLTVRGREVWGEAVLSPMKDASGKVFAVGIVHRDVTEQKRAEAELQTAAQQWQKTFDAVSDSVCLLDKDQRIVRWNKTTEKLLQREGCELRGRHCWEIMHGTPEPIPDCPVRRMRQSLRRESMELQVGERCFDVAVDAVLDADGQLAGAVHIIADITDRKQAEEALRANVNALSRLHKVSLLFAQESDLQPVLLEIIDAAIAIVGADFGNIQLLDPASGDLKIAAHRGFPEWWVEFWNSVSRGKGVCGTALERGVRVIVEDVEQSPVFVGTPALEIQRRVGVRSVQSTPLLSRSGKIIGMFSTHYRGPQRFGEHELTMLDLLARQAADLIEHWHAKAALAENEAKFRSYTEHAPLAILVSDRVGHVLDCNPAAIELLGYDATALKRMSAFDIHPEEDRANVGRAWESLARGERVAGEFRAKRRDGAIIWVELSAGLIGADRVLAYLRDITERKRGEDLLRESEERFRTVFEKALDGIALADLETKRLGLANSEFCRMTGYSAKEVRRLTVADVHPPEDLEDVMRGFHAQARGEISLSAEQPIRRKDGSVFYADIAARPMQMGGRWYMVGIFRDVTERRRAEEVMRQSEERYRTLVESVTDYIYTVQVEEGKAVRTTHGPGCLGVTGYTSAEYQADDQLWFRMVPAEDRPAVLEQSRRLIAGQQTAPLEHRITHKDGTIRWVRDAAVSRHDSQGRVTGYEGMIKDITERRELEQRLLQAQKMEAIGRLAGGVAHDFRNQLTVIKGFGEMLLRRSLVLPEARQHVEEIVRAADRSTDLSRQLLVFSRLQPLRPQVVHPAGLLTSMGTAMERMVGEDVRVSLICPPDTGSVNLDVAQFQQAIMNLVANARDAMPRGGKLTLETADVDLDSEAAARCGGVQAGPCVLVTVSDSGHGVDTETAKKIFEPYFTTKPLGHGTGLGLPMVYGFVRQSNGGISVESVPGRGTTFRMYFPREARPGQVPQAPVSAAALPTGTETILVVEDEEVVRRTLVETLRECGYTVLEAGNAAEALSAAGNHSADIPLVVSDVIMPGVSGPAVVNLLQRTRPGMRALYVSGYSGGILRERGITEDAEHLLAKPVDARQLAETVRRVLDHPS